MDKPKTKQKLREKQKRFCLEYIKDYNGTQAATRAGYSKRTANEQASRLLANVNISSYLNELKEEVKEKSILEITDLDLGIKFMVDSAKIVPVFNEEGKHLVSQDGEILTTVNYRGLGKGLELYGKRLAAYSDKLDHSNKDGTLKPVIYIPDNGRDKTK